MMFIEIHYVINKKGDITKSYDIIIWYNVGKTIINHPWLGMVTIPPIKMVIWGWFIIVLPTLIIFDMISVWFHINWFVGIIHFVGFMISLTKGTFWIIWLIRIMFSDSWTISNFVGFILLIHEVMKKNGTGCWRGISGWTITGNEPMWSQARVEQTRESLKRAINEQVHCQRVF